MGVHLQQIEVGPVAEARLFAALSVECRVYCSKEDCFLCEGWQDGVPECISL